MMAASGEILRQFCGAVSSITGAVTCQKLPKSDYLEINSMSEALCAEEDPLFHGLWLPSRKWEKGS